MANQNPFGKAQTELFKYILLHPRCSFDQIRQDCFPDKHTKYLHNLIYENRDMIEKTESADRDYPTEYRIRLKTLAGIIDLKHYVETGNLIAKYVQQDLFQTKTE